MNKLIAWFKRILYPSSFLPDAPAQPADVNRPVDVKGLEAWIPLKTSVELAMERNSRTLNQLVYGDPAERLDAEAVEALASEPTVTFKEILEMGVPGRPSQFNGPSPNFTWAEVACRDKARTLPTGVELDNVRHAAAMMEEIRAYLGNKPITVNSWYRTPAYNKQVGGAPKTKKSPGSMHMYGLAVDFTVAGMTPKQVQSSLRKAVAAGKLHIGGLGSYEKFSHADLGKRREWQG